MSAFEWRGDRLYAGRRLVGEIVPDDRFAGMWRIKTPCGELSDMANRTRARDAALGFALEAVRQPQGSSPMRKKRRAA